MTVKEQVEQIKTGTEQILPEGGLEKKLAKKDPLRVKLGLDPTAPDLHLGHAVVLSKLKQLQDMGHDIIFLIGDFTARIGDPTGKSKTRPALTEKEIERNMKTYFDQVGKILDPNKVIIHYNSEWLDKLSSKDMVKLCGQTTLARLIEREDFAKRLKTNQPIGFHELLYPLFQGYDSVELKADIELGGTDQTFNLLMGRFLQEQYGQEPQVIITMPLLEGVDGVEKMSKSLGNAIGLNESAEQAFGKLMSISDKLMWRYFKVLLQENTAAISAMEEGVAAGNIHPMALKKQMAHQIISRFWNPKEADAAQKQFEALFEKKDYSQAQPVELPKGTPHPIWIVDLLKLLGAIKSSSEAKRLIEAKAVSLNDTLIDDFKAKVAWKKGTIIKVGKHRIYRIS